MKTKLAILDRMEQQAFQLNGLGVDVTDLIGEIRELRRDILDIRRAA